MSNSIVIEATAEHTATLIFLHGLAETGKNWIEALKKIQLPNVKIICPTGPTIPITWKQGTPMTAWFDVLGMKTGAPEDEDGIKSSSKIVHKVIEDEIKSGTPSNRIIVGGFSQGGALAIYSAITFSQQLGGVFSLSSWLALHQQFPENVVGNKTTPFLLCHGDKDPIIPHLWGQMAITLLKKTMTNVEFKTYAGLDHRASDEEFLDVKRFIEQLL
ncbi:acyl-protein thioesterase 1-like [Aphidius gifuensis]|uniref:acyl-protein thioesterase 1-like n=1 Tax=Aphidius gifuensis TaxID=684658 RepID=UPI001CDCA46D|nr:acyl-protein thioesterase 1-like [Aphidius gifuensis]